MRTQTSLFLSQSYKDTWDDYQRSLTRENFFHWDYVVLTASNDRQAEGFRAQIEQRRSLGLLPANTQFAVVPDPEGKRVGSGGATLGVIRYIAEQTGKTDFSGLRILVIHSGGDSKRVPQYSALGKLFSPVPHELPDGRASTLFDEFIIAMSAVPGRIREGMLLLSGDVLLLFNPLQIDYSGKGAAAISFKEDVQTGKNHGVFLRGEDGNVARFLHKQTEASLRSRGAVNARNCVDIDTGAVIFSSQMLAALYGMISTCGKTDESKYAALVNETVRLSLYGDFLYPLAEASTLEEFYQEKPEGSFCPELTRAREALWQVLRPFRMKLLRLAPAKFIHFGTTREILLMMSGGIREYQYLGWSGQVNSSVGSRIAGYNSVVSDENAVGEGCYLEVSYVHRRARVGNNTVLSYVDIHNETVPENVVLHGLKQRDGRFVVRIYGVQDNPKDTLEAGGQFLGMPLETFLTQNAISREELWEGADHSLWNAKLYPACDTVEEAVEAALNVYELSRGRGDVARWRDACRKSLCAGFNDADPDAIISWNRRMEELVRMDRLAKLIESGASVAQAQEVLKAQSLTKIQREWLEKQASQANLRDLKDFRRILRLYYYIGKALGGREGEAMLERCFRTIRQTILRETMDNLTYNDTCVIAKDRHRVRLPLRVNWGGGWSDTPPYCHENGGTVLNAAILLDGRMPVEVSLEKIPEYQIVFDSRDMDVHGEFDTIAPLQRTGDPYDPFALQKACLLACGVIPKEGGSLEEILKRLGGGFVMRSEVTGVPKGSGLGTSSILSAACVKATFEFLGISYTQEDLYSHVLCMEQIMSTGGGWQDQVGGVAEGIKFITSAPSLNQQLKVRPVEIPEAALQELRERFVLIYTGQRRLARNLLRDVVGRYIGNIPDALYALDEIQKVAALMRFELERGNIDAFAKLLDYHWELSQKVDAGSTNTLIDQIFQAVEDLVDGKMICGAGGGGFLQVILKKNVTKTAVRNRLKEVFEDNDVDVWDCALI